MADHVLFTGTLTTPGLTNLRLVASGTRLRPVAELRLALSRRRAYGRSDYSPSKIDFSLGLTLKTASCIRPRVTFRGRHFPTINNKFRPT